LPATHPIRDLYPDSTGNSKNSSPTKINIPMKK
jgi:hypothetical protein